MTQPTVSPSKRNKIEFEIATRRQQPMIPLLEQTHNALPQNLSSRHKRVKSSTINTKAVPHRSSLGGQSTKTKRRILLNKSFDELPQEPPLKQSIEGSQTQRERRPEKVTLDQFIPNFSSGALTKH